MAVETGTGAGGNNGVSPELEQAEIDLIEFDKEKDITEFDDGTAIIGEFEEQMPKWLNSQWILTLI
jgi:hypothetical protein